MISLQDVLTAVESLSDSEAEYTEETCSGDTDT